MLDPGKALFDNPILIKHVRSRFRPAQVLPWVTIVLVLSACAAWMSANYRYYWIGSTVGAFTLLGLQILFLAFIGSHQITSSLGGARESGLLDFHRVSPLPPSVVALGFFLGAPIREYALAAITVPFALFAAYQIDDANPWHGLLWLAQLEVAILLTTWNVHALTMLGCLTRKKPRGSMTGTIVTVIVVLIGGYTGAVGFVFGSQWLLEEERRLNFFGRMIPWLAWLLIYEIPALGFAGLAVARKMKAERTHSFTKPQALACLATLTVLGLGGIWKVSRLLAPNPPWEPTGADAIMLAAVYVLSLAAMILTITITPDSSEYIKGMRRAARGGRRRASPWSDAGSNRFALFALCALVLTGATIAVNVVGRQPLVDPSQFGFWGTANPEMLERAKSSDAAWLASRQAALSRPIAIAVLTVAYVGLALQYFSLRTRRSGPALLTLFLFMAWLVPLLIGAIIGMNALADQSHALTFLAISPLPGIALSSGLGKPPGADAIQLAALAPPITFAFIFNYLLVLTQRNIDRRLREAEKLKEPIPPALADALETT